MAKNTNSASRLLGILKPIPFRPDNTQTLSVWVEAFGITEANDHRQSRLVADRLNGMLTEVELIREQMLATDYSSDLYAPALSRIEQALSAMFLPGSWVQARQHLTPETFMALEYCREILPDEESAISPEDLAEIASQVEQLQGSLATAQLPIRLKILVEHQLDLIRRALAEYRIHGAKAFREAARTALGEIVEVRETIETHAEVPALTMLGAIWKKVNSVVEAALKAEKFAELAQKIWDLLP